MPPCVFCKIVNGQLPAAKVYEDKFALAFLDVRPVNPGHTLVISKTHKKDLLDLSEEEASNLMMTIKKITPAILKAVNANSFNLGLNNGPESGQIIGHVHFHIMPRHANDGHRLWQGESYANDQEMRDLAEMIRRILR